LDPSVIVPSTGDTWEFFVIGTDGHTAADKFSAPFAKDWITSRTVTVKAAYMATLPASLIKVKFKPGENPHGADGALTGPPAGFVPTMTRTHKIAAKCCPEDSSISWTTEAKNTFGTYSESWSDALGTATVHAKEVDGVKVE